MKKNNPIKLRTVFMGTSSFASTILAGLIDAQYNIIAVYTQPDKKVGRNREIAKSEVKIFSEEHKISVFQPEKFDDEAISEFSSLKPDLVVVAAYGKILSKKVLDIPGFACLNVHASLLPRFRGPSPIQNAILQGEKQTGVTIMLMDEGVDTGDILSQDQITIQPNETTLDLSERLANIGKDLLLNTIPLWIEGKIEARSQDLKNATMCQLIERQDGKINWADDAQVIYNRYRALYPWPGVYTFWKKPNSRNDLRIKINKMGIIKINPEAKHHLGQVFELGDKIGVQTSQGVILLEEIQLEGKANLNIKQFINGYPDFLTSVLV